MGHGPKSKYLYTFSFKKNYLFIFRQRGREGEKHQCVVASHGDQRVPRCPYWGPGLQPRHVPWLGIKPVILWFAGWHSIHWTTQARARYLYTFSIEERHAGLLCLVWFIRSTHTVQHLLCAKLDDLYSVRYYGIWENGRKYNTWFALLRNLAFKLGHKMTLVEIL